jgi:biopolymer transport protein ExbD
MSLIPEEELRREKSLNLAPMVDFLFLVVAILATLAITRTTLRDTEVDLVKRHVPSTEAPIPGYSDHYVINVSVTAEGAYKWITDMDEYLMKDPSSVQNALKEQIASGLLPKEKEKTKVLLHVDRRAPWESIAQLILSIRESGFKIHPVYEPVKNTVDQNETKG